MEDAKITQIQNENNRLREENKTLREGNQRLAKSLGFNRDYIEMAAKLKAVEYIIRTKDRFIDKEELSAILGIPLPKKDEDCESEDDVDEDWEDC